MRRITQRIRTDVSIRGRVCREGINRYSLVWFADDNVAAPYIDETRPVRPHRHLVCYGDERERAQNNLISPRVIDES